MGLPLLDKAKAPRSILNEGVAQLEHLEISTEVILLTLLLPAAGLSLAASLLAKSVSAFFLSSRGLELQLLSTAQEDLQATAPSCHSFPCGDGWVPKPKHGSIKGHLQERADRRSQDSAKQSAAGRPASFSLVAAALPLA